MNPVATRGPEAFSLVLTSTPPGGSGLVHKISERPSGALVATGVTCAPGVYLVVSAHSGKCCHVIYVDANIKATTHCKKSIMAICLHENDALHSTT